MPWTEFDAELVARAVKVLRLDARMTQAELAERAGLAFETISRIESGREPPSLRTAMLIANVFEQPLDVVVGRRPIDAAPTRRNQQDQRRDYLRELADHADELPLETLGDLVRLVRTMAQAQGPSAARRRR